MRLLFIDDCQDDVLLANDALRNDGLVFEGRSVSTIGEAAAALAEGPWSAVISDYNFEVHTGLDMLALVRRQDAGIPFILLSGTIGEERAAEAIREGASDYVMKDRLTRLPGAVRREVAAAEARNARQRLESQRQQAEERYRTTFERVPVGIGNLGRDGRFINVNAWFRNLLGYEEHELIGQPLSKFVHPDDASTAGTLWRRFADGDTAARYERRYLRKDGGVVWTNVTVSAAGRDADGEPEYLIGLVEDISEQTAAREKLRLQSHRLECPPPYDDRDALIGAVGVSHALTRLTLRAQEVQLAAAQEMARIGSWTYDFATGERQWSDSFCRIYGFEPGVRPSVEATLQRIHPDDRERIRSVDQRAHMSAKSVIDEFRIVADGAERVMTMQFQIICDASGTPSKGFGFVQDITESKLLEEELRRRTIQQSVVANLGQLALSGASTSFLLEQAIESVGAILALEYTGVLKNNGDDAVLVAGTQWQPGTGKSPGLTLAVPIRSADGMEWGLLAGSSQQPRPMAHSDSDFLKSVAAVIGQALDRASADAELRTRARQQSVVAKLGRLVLTSLDDTVYAEVCELLKTSIGADYTVLAELADDGMLHLRAWTFRADEPTPIAIRENAQADYAILKGEPVVVDDYRIEDRFDTFSLTVPYGILSGAMVPIASAARTFGVLSAQSRKANHFRQEDVDFLQTLANVLADAMARDVAQRAVETSENRYRRIFAGATEIIYTIDGEGRIITLNPAFETITGWSTAEWIGLPFAELIAPGERERLLAVFNDLLTSKSTAQLEAVVRGRHREVILEVTSFPQVIDGEVVEIYGFARDVTDARRTDAERERVTRSLQLLLESTVEGIYTIDMLGRCTMVNRSAASFLGIAPEELMGVNVHEILHATKPDGTPNPIETCHVHGVLRDGEAVTVSNDVFRRKDKTLIPVAYSVAPIIDHGERVGAVVTFTDQTERRKLEMRLEQANRLSSLGRLAATVAHEFNNVLMGIAPFVEVVRRSRSPEKVSTSLDYITSSVKRGRRITEDILRYTQPAEPSLAPLDVVRWLETIASEAQSVLASGYTVTIDAQPLCVEADANQMHQILTNLLLNARDAMPRGGTIAIEVLRESADARFSFGAVEDPSRFAHFIIRDTGTGMPDQTLQHAFEPLFTTKKNGTGLGLAVTHQVVQRHGGEIFVESAVGVGTTFHIFIPLSEQQTLCASEPGGEQPQALEAPQILLVEDDPTVSAGIRALLEFEGFHVTVAETGRDALAQIERQRPDVVLLDVGLPDLDGKMVYAELVRMYPTLPVIFSTGHTERGGLEHLLSNENVGYLMKPYDYDTLLKELTRVMASRVY